MISLLAVGFGFDLMVSNQLDKVEVRMSSLFPSSLPSVKTRIGFALILIQNIIRP